MKIAALDVGTNTVLMLIAESAPDGTVRTLADLSRITRMGQGVDKNHRLDPQAAARTLEAITDFVAEAHARGVDKIVSAATAALRDASDGDQFVARVRKAGVELDLISGETEAWLSYLAVTRGLPIDPSSKLLIIDIGGGSTEFLRAEPGAKLEMASLQIGSVRMTERIIRSDPPSAHDAAELRVAIDHAIKALGWNYHPDRMVAIAGTATTVCAVALEMQTYDRERIHGCRLARTEVERVIGKLGSIPLAERRALPGMEPGRADVIFAGAAILERVMCEFECDSVIVSDQGVRWGLVWRELGAQKPA